MHLNKLSSIYKKYICKAEAFCIRRSIEPTSIVQMYGIQTMFIFATHIFVISTIRRNSFEICTIFMTFEINWAIFFQMCIYFIRLEEIYNVSVCSVEKIIVSSLLSCIIVYSIIVYILCMHNTWSCSVTILPFSLEKEASTEWSQKIERYGYYCLHCCNIFSCVP